MNKALNSGLYLFVASILILNLVGCSDKEQEIKIATLESTLQEVESKLSDSEMEVENVRKQLADANLKIETLNATLAEINAAEKKAKEAKIRAEKEAKNAKKKKDEETLKNWAEVVSLVENKQSPGGKNLGSLLESTTAKMTENGRGIIFFDKQFEAIGLIGFQTFIEKLGIPDYILEDISSTRPINGRQEKTYGNVVISWSVDRESSGGAFGYIEISLSLRLQD